MMSRVFSLLTHDNKIHKPILKDNLEGHVTYANSLVSQSVKFTNCNKNAHLISSLLNIVVKRMIDHELQLYDEQQAGQKKGGLESLSHEELVAKCKNLLNIAQKAKKAKDEALEELSNQDAKFKEELKSIRDKASADTSHSIQMKKNLLDLQLEYDTCQKKMSSLEEEHKACNARIKKIENQLSIEYDKRKNAELLNNNLNEDLNKLTESSGQMRLICKRVMEEKEEIEKDFKEIFQQKIEWTRYLQTAFPNESITSVEDWIAILTNSSQSKSFGDLEEENRSLKGGNEELKNKVEKLERVIEDLIKKKDGVSSEIVSLKNDKEKMMEELSEVRNSRDALLKKLDEVRIETTQLIENSEKLSEENGVLRFEKEKFESSFNSLSTEHLKSINEIVDLKATNDELVGRLESTRRKLEEGESGLNKMKSEKIVVDSRVVELENCVRSLEEKLEENCRENSEKLALSIENADIKRQLETMMEENADLARKIQLQDMDKEKAVIAVKDECIKYEKDLEKLSFDIRAKDEIIHELQAQSEGFKKVEENLSQKFEEHNKEKDEIVDNLKAHCKTLENELEKLRKDINEQVLNKDKVVELQLECDSLQKVEHNLRQKIEDQKQEKERIVNELKGNCKVFEDKIDVLKQELKNKDEVVKSLETKCFEFENEMKLLKQRIDEQNQNKEKIVNELQSECSSLKKSEKLLEQKIEELKKREEMYKKQFLEYDKLRDEIDELKQEKEIQLENHRKTLENHKSRESWNIERIQQQLKNHYESELVMHVEKSEKLSDKLKKYVNKLEVLQKENREVNNRLIVIEEEKNKIEKMLENNLKIKENSCEIEMMNSDSNKKSSDIENVLQKRSKLISDTNRVCLNFFKMVLSSVDSRTGSGLEDIRKYIDEATSENFEVDIVELDNLFKTVCKVVIGKGEVQSELEKRLEVIGNEKEVLKKEKEVLESEKGELESREKELLDKICGLEKDFEATKLGVNQKEDEQRKKLEEDEKMRSSLKECKEKLRMSLEDKKKTEEIIDDLKCETGKLNSLLIVVQQERDSASSLLHKCQLEKRDLESQVEKLRLEDEENLHKLQDLNDRYLSMEEKLNFIFNENEELKGVLELEEVHDNLLKEIENMIGNNVEVLSDTVSNEFRNKSIKFDSSILLKYLNEIISSLNETIKEKNNKLNGLDEEVELVKKQLENILSESEEVKMLVRVLNERVSGFETESIELRVKILGQIIENSKFFEGLCDSYAKVTGADLVEARKSLEVKLVELNENGWKTDGKTEGKESEKQMADDFKAKEEEIVQLQEKNKELKGVAVKMKKKINDLNQLLDAEKQKVDAERTKLSQLSAVAKNAQMLQQECDRLADELEECKKTIKQLQKVNDSLESEHKDLQQKYNEKENRFANVEKEIAALKTQLESAVSKESSLVKELEEVKTEKHVEEVIRKECDKELIITQDKLRKVQLDLDQALLESQKHTVLTQEKHDYEQQLSQSHQNMSQLECKLKEQGTSLAQLTTQLEAERRDKDELAIQLTKLTADSQKAIDSARTQIDALLNRVSQLEQDLRTVTVERQRFEEEAERLEREFGAYKVRAQSVLRQKEHGGGSAEQEFRDKCAQLQEHCDRTKAQLDSTVEELEQVKLKLGSVLAEKEALDKKCENINNILVQRNKELDRRMMEHRQHKLSTDTLIQCYKTQLEEKERGHQIELDALRMQLTKLSSRVNSSDTDLGGSDAVKEVGDVENANFYHQTEHHLSISTHANNTRHSPIDSAGEHGKTLPPRPPLIEREDGEGSEGNEVSMFPGSLSNKTGLVPLAKLLSSSLGSDEERDVLSLEKFESLQNEMLASNTRVKHLAALLSEAEKDSALMEEQNTVLKEEIRRLQRCIERQPHAHNVEYLKNVVFKFATLASGDEKSRLVPVLDTILKLSPEEHKQLAAVAKGETEQTSGWSSYLPTWQ